MLRKKEKRVMITKEIMEEIIGSLPIRSTKINIEKK